MAAKKPILKRSTPRASKRNVQFEHRCQRFVETAETLFLKRGYAGTSVNEVVRIAGGSLATLYAEYPTKDALFEAVMSGRCARLFEGTRENAEGVQDARAELLSLARRMLDRMLSDDALAIYRLAVHEGPNFPSVSKAVLVNGLETYLDRLGSYLDDLTQAGKLAIDQPRVAAELFLTLVQGQLRTRSAIGAADISPARRKAHVAQAIDAFLRVYPLPPDKPAKRAARR